MYYHGTRVQYVRKSADRGYTIMPMATVSTRLGCAAARSRPPRQHTAAVAALRGYSAERIRGSRIRWPCVAAFCGYSGLPCPTHSDTRPPVQPSCAATAASGPATLGSIDGCAPEPHGYSPVRIRGIRKVHKTHRSQVNIKRVMTQNRHVGLKRRMTSTLAVDSTAEVGAGC